MDADVCAWHCITNIGIMDGMGLLRSGGRFLQINLPLEGALELVS